MRRIGVLRIAVLVSVFIFIVGCSKESDKNLKTIQTYLEYEFTGPSDELINALKQEGAYPPELQAYVEENYKPLVADLENFVLKNFTLIYLWTAYENGYHLKPTNIEIQKIDGIKEDAYDYEVSVEYTKDEQTNTANVTGIINLNENGKISVIRNLDDGGLLEKMQK